MFLTFTLHCILCGACHTSATCKLRELFINVKCSC